MKSNIFKKAHELTKKIIKAGDNYKATFRLCLSFVYSQIKRGVNTMVELVGSEKQVELATKLRAKLIKQTQNKIDKLGKMKSAQSMITMFNLNMTRLEMWEKVIEIVENETKASQIIAYSNASYENIVNWNK